MEKQDFNDGWFCFGGVFEQGVAISVPFDALIHQNRSETSLGAINTGYWNNANFRYEKRFTAPEDWAEKSLILDFEGVYHNATVFLNGVPVAEHHYGYTEFFVDITSQVKLNQENVLQVLCRCNDEPNSRWYSGSGILRPVSLLVGEKEHLLPGEIRLAALSLDPAIIEVKIPGKTGLLNLIIKDSQGETVVTYEGSVPAEGVHLEVQNPHPWSPDDPYLYSYQATYEGRDVSRGRFGLRVLQWGEEGLLLNGERLILRGACIHSDNGLLGGVSNPYTERRKIRLLKAAGYNALRSAHNPCDKSLLDAADEMGFLIMDELYDGWYIHKTHHDFASHFAKDWKGNIEEWINKDYNHPSVIMYSLGNEVAETSEKKGIALVKEMKAFLNALDKTRPVTTGVNIFFNLLYSLGFGVYNDKKAEAAEKDANKKKSVGSEFFNDIAGKLGAGFMKFGASLHGSDRKTREAFAELDVAGYNYGIKRYKHDLRHYPHRLILGSETFVFDTPEANDFMKKNPRIIGDFVWAGMDYLGEVGIGAWLYQDYAKDFNKGLGWITAGSGRIDLTGRLTSEAYYTRVAYGLDPIHLSVLPPRYFKKKHSPSAWRMTNTLPSWAYPGEEGKKCLVEVYSLAPKVRLYVNEKKVGEKKTHNGVAEFITLYQNGTISAVNISKDGEIKERASLSSLTSPASLKALPEEASIGKHDLAYIRFRVQDEAGHVNTSARSRVVIQSITGGSLAAFGSACPFNPDTFYDQTSDTYFGECLLIVKPDGTGPIKVKAQSEFGVAEAQVQVS